MNTTGTLFRVCGKFADELYEACSPYQIQTLDAQCQQVGKKWSSGKDFIENIFFGNMYAEDNTACFNSSSLLQPTFWTLIILLALLANLFQ